jgi:hypothetical protein
MRTRSHTPDAELFIALLSNASSAIRTSTTSMLLGVEQ